MTKVNAYVTSDGFIHDTHAKALRHAGDRFGAALEKIARRVAIEGDGKYHATVLALESLLPQFVELIALYADIKLVEGTE